MPHSYEKCGIFQFLMIGRFVKCSTLRKIFLGACLLVFLLPHSVFCEIQGNKGGNYFKDADSLLNQLLERPETRMKEIAPAELLFRKTLAKHPEVFSIIRTNSKGFIVNAVSRGDANATTGKDVSRDKWHNIPHKTMKPYHSPISQGRGKNHYSFFCSKPIIIKNSSGKHRFGGVIALHIFQISSSPHLGLKQKEKKDTSAIVHPDTLRPLASLHKDNTDAMPDQCADAITPKNMAPLDQNASPDQLFSSHKELPPLKNKKALNERIWIFIVAGLLIIVAASAVIFPLKGKRREKKRLGNGHGALLYPTIQPTDGLPVSMQDQSIATEITQVFGQRQSMTEIAADSDQALHTPVVGEETISKDLVAEMPTEGQSIGEEPPSVEDKPASSPPIMAEEAEAIRAHLKQELTDTCRREIRQKYYEAICRQELDNLRQIVREKLIEKEMPLLVKFHRTELSKEIRQKMEAAFYDHIERHERNVMKTEIIKKLQTDDYQQMFQEEREKLRLSLRQQITEKETETIEGILRGELTDQLRIQIQPEAGSIRSEIRKEMTDRIESELLEREYDAIVADRRESLKEQLRKEIAEKEQESIRDDLLIQITQEERARINSDELGQIIEKERNRIAEEEAPALREHIRAELRDQELEAMHTRVKNEISAETSQAIRETCEAEYNDLLEKKMAEYRDMIERRLYSEMKKSILDEYHTLTEDLERLSGSISNVEVLESLSQTITLLSDEKKKYKYFNLNSAQTESLLEYLKRVQSRFNIFFDKIDEALREMELKINSVMNKLDNG